MTRKHFEEMAKKISYIPTGPEFGGAFARRMAFLVTKELFQEVNPRFDVKKYAEACDVKW